MSENTSKLRDGLLSSIHERLVRVPREKNNTLLQNKTLNQLSLIGTVQQPLDK